MFWFDIDESHSIIHGRPFPLKGEYVANLFVHFEPMNHSETYQAKTRKLKNHDEQYKRDVSQGVGGHEGTNHVKGKLQGSGLPLYVIPGSPEAKNYIERHDLEEEDDEASEEDEVSVLVLEGLEETSSSWRRPVSCRCDGFLATDDGVDPEEEEDTESNFPIVSTNLDLFCGR